MKTYLKSYIREPNGKVPYYKVIAGLFVFIGITCLLYFGPKTYTLAISFKWAFIATIITVVLTQTLAYFIMDEDDYKTKIDSEV